MAGHKARDLVGMTAQRPMIGSDFLYMKITNVVSKITENLRPDKYIVLQNHQLSGRLDAARLRQGGWEKRIALVEFQWMHGSTASVGRSDIQVGIIRGNTTKA